MGGLVVGDSVAGTGGGVGGTVVGDSVAGTGGGVGGKVVGDSVAGTGGGVGLVVGDLVTGIVGSGVTGSVTLSTLISVDPMSFFCSGTCCVDPPLKLP